MHRNFILILEMIGRGRTCAGQTALPRHSRFNWDILNDEVVATSTRWAFVEPQSQVVKEPRTKLEKQWQRITVN